MNRPHHGCAVFLGLFISLAAAHGQGSLSGQNFIHRPSCPSLRSSVGGGLPVFRNQELTANTNLVRLEPALLAVAAERFKVSLWQQLGLKSDSTWLGKVYFVLHPARSPDE